MKLPVSIFALFAISISLLACIYPNSQAHAGAAESLLSWPSSPSPRVITQPGVITTVRDAGIASNEVSAASQAARVASSTGARVANAAVARTWPGIAATLAVLAVGYGIQQAKDYLRNEPGTEANLDPNRPTIPGQNGIIPPLRIYWPDPPPSSQFTQTTPAPYISGTCKGSYGSTYTNGPITYASTTNAYAQCMSPSGSLIGSYNAYGRETCPAGHSINQNTTPHTCNGPPDWISDGHCDIVRVGNQWGGGSDNDCSDPALKNGYQLTQVGSDSTITFPFSNGSESLTIHGDGTATDTLTINNPDGTTRTITTQLSAPATAPAGQTAPDGTIFPTGQTDITRTTSTTKTNPDGSTTTTATVPTASAAPINLPTDYNREVTQQSIDTTLKDSLKADTSLTVDSALTTTGIKDAENNFKLPGNTRTVDLSSTLMIQNTSATCPSNPSFSAFGKSFTLNTSGFCSIGIMLGYLTMLGAAIVSIKIVAGALNG